MPRQLGKHPGLDLVFRIGAAVEVLGIERLAARMRDEILVEELELFRRYLPVALPPHRLFSERIADGMLVLGRAAGVYAGLRADRAALDDGGFARRDRMFVELGSVEIPMDCSKLFETEFVGAVSTVPQTRLPHENLHSSARRPPEFLAGAMSNARLSPL